MVKVKAYDIFHPSIPQSKTFEEVLFQEEITPPLDLYVNREDDLKTYKKIVRRMNRISKYAYLSATNLLNSLPEVERDPWSIGTIFSTSFASFDNVLSHLNKLYSKGIEAISPIEFTYAVGNALISGITINNNFKGPSGTFPDSDVLPIVDHYFTQGACDEILMGSYNALIPEVASYYENLYKCFYHGKTKTTMDHIEIEQRMTESYITILFENQEEGQGIYLQGQVSVQKKEVNSEGEGLPKAEIQMGSFEKEDFIRLFKSLEEEGIALDQVDAIVSSAFGNPSFDQAEAEAMEETFGKIPTVYPAAIFPNGGCGSFSIDNLVAFELLKKKKFPLAITRNMGEKGPETVLSLGVNEMGSIIGGVWKWKQD